MSSTNIATLLDSNFQSIAHAIINTNSYEEFEKLKDQLLRENVSLKEEIKSENNFEEIIGADISLKEVLSKVKMVADTDATVLIRGETGTGKELISRSIHNSSKRKDRSLIKVNCPAIPSGLIESELFGHEKGAFTDAHERKIGKFQLANNSTLFLDEIGDMDYGLQAKLLRALQEGVIQPVGSNRQISVDVRIVSSTNRDLEAAMADGSFREDLYYRLNVVPMHLPALRDHSEDIPMLVSHFMMRAADSLGLPPGESGDDALAALQACDWPGNVRQLRNLVEWLLIMAPGDAERPIRANMLPPELSASAPPAMRSEHTGEIMAMPLRKAREMFERQYLAAQLMRFGGNISRTAVFIGMERSALHRKLKGLGLSSDGLGRADSAAATPAERSIGRGWR